MARTKVVVIADVEDPAKWEKSFRTHGDLFLSQTVNKPIDISINGNRVAVCLRPEDLETFMKIFKSPATVKAMELDGVKRDTVQVYVFNKKFKLK